MLTIQKKKITHKNDLKKVDLELFIRFLEILSETDPTGITYVIMKTGTNHLVCMKYVKFLEKLQLIRLIVHEKNKDVYITERGKQALQMISSVFND